jgi:transcriptional antiterminator RfaH
MNNNERNWYLVYSKPRMEQVAQENLQRQGYETYLPMLRQTRRRNGRYYDSIEACFPRYLFIHLDTRTDNWSPIRSTLGVAKMVEFGGLPAMVPNDLIAALQANENADGLQQLQEPELKAGDKVTVLEGPFAGYQGIYQQHQSRERVAILMDIVGKNTLMTISVHELQRI